MVPGGFDIYMIIFETLVLTAAFIVVYLYWNTSFELPGTDTNSKQDSKSKEGFIDLGNSGIANISMCPGTSKSYTAKNGDTLCCEGNPAGTDCEGKTICTLSSTGSRTHPSCAEYLKSYYAAKGKQVCPRSLPQYYEDENSRAFCTNGLLNQELNAPANKAAEQCSIGGGGMKDPKSCEVRVALDRMQCPAPGCQKFAQAFGNEPVVLMANFRDSSLMTHTCYDKDSLFHLWRDILGPDWRAKLSHIDFEHNINFCDVAKKYYIDKTLSRNKIQV
jgi:hypothetical protein